MGIVFEKGDLFRAGTSALVNPVNCEGVMGAGLAKVFKERFPLSSAAYMEHCREGLLRPGQIFITEPEGDPPQTIVHFATKDKWRHPSQLDWIDFGLRLMIVHLHMKKIRDVALPALGCGLGELRWPVVKELIEKRLAPINNLYALCYEPVVSQRSANTEEAKA
jgi:O-acetyl-ADP-ribose deacetylase (regulator of RNase III)